MGLFADEMVEMVQAENLYTSRNYDGYTYTHTHTHTQPSGGWEEKWTLSESDHNLMKNGNTLEFLCLDSTLSPEHH